MKFVTTLCLCMMVFVGVPAQADVATGKSTYASRGCIGCHGADGFALTVLKGRDADFIRQTLTDFRSGARSSPVMNAMAAGLKDADIENLADYIDSLK